MPTPHEILDGLAQIANRAVVVSIAWHVIVGLCALAIGLGFRPQARVASAALSAPLACVGILAWVFGNPFNGAAFTLLAVTLAVLSVRMPHAAVARSQRWSLILGSLLMLFGWCYPHFLEGRSAFAYLYAAPLGTIPCPTLSFVAGAALAGSVPAGSAATLLIAAAACFYAVFGVLRLGVTIDLVLLAGAVGLLGRYLQQRSQRRRAV